MKTQEEIQDLWAARWAHQGLTCMEKVEDYMHRVAHEASSHDDLCNQACNFFGIHRPSNPWVRTLAAKVWNEDRKENPR